ncbi:alpha/beta fold hydrolase [Rhizorhapis suberifaciens]|uniref:Lysophospholipase n=1 Tax=Rhizorhapis suberifaciens TaxID=13656 RepID=A0A840HX25_9SPHN|nr:alpha/beta hydrolase [Rhizorhapis suberifaciens]MBB4642130.1 lysophospholipase [Rhizorhapis suberifaciens]
MNPFTPAGRFYPEGTVIDYWQASDGWPLRRFTWPAAGRGSLLFLTGRGDMFEKYLETFGHFHTAGWDISSFDWRGQGGSGRSSSGNRSKCGFNVLLEDLAAFFRQWISERAGPHVMIGHSMGGHLLIRGLSENTRVQPDASVAVAPMLGINSGPVPVWLGACIARLMCAFGDPGRRAWKDMEKPGVGISGRQALLTHCDERYADEMFWHQERPDLKLGPPSWHWLNEAYSSLSILQESDALERITTPLLILAAERDRLVDIRSIRRAAARIGQSRLHVYGAMAAHEILREADPIRSDALARIDAFFDEVAPAR